MNNEAGSSSDETSNDKLDIAACGAKQESDQVPVSDCN
jgi:hypothetical protein